MTQAPDPNFNERLLALFRQIHPLDQVPRAGYLLRGVAHPESVSAHSHYLAVLALLFLEEHPGRYNGQRLLAMALTHDLPEALLMDIPMPYADAYLSNAKHQAEEAIYQDLFAGYSDSLRSLHREFQAAETPEARLLRGLDKAQMMLKIINYEREQRGGLEEFWHNPKNFCDYGVPEVARLFDAICARAGRVKPV